MKLFDVVANDETLWVFDADRIEAVHELLVVENSCEVFIGGRGKTVSVPFEVFMSCWRARLAGPEEFDKK